MLVEGLIQENLHFIAHFCSSWLSILLHVSFQTCLMSAALYDLGEESQQKHRAQENMKFCSQNLSRTQWKHLSNLEEIDQG